MTTEREISSEEQQLLADADVWFDDHQAQITSELLDLVNISSVSDNSQPQTGQPYGKGVREVFDHVIAKALEWGFSINDYDGHAISVNYPIINDKNKLHQDQDIALVSHLDVVPPGDGWDWPAFQAFEKDGYIVGRGTADNKGAAIVDLFLLQFFNSQQHQFKHRIRVLLGGAEETTLDDMTYVVEHYGAPYQAIITDSPFPVNNAQKGHLDIDVIIPAGPIISGFSVGSS
jgi:succinyl-diaminopimelate desuccinylase